MRLKSACLLILLAGCDEGPPPFDELPLRDALGADPEMVALLPDPARRALAARFEAARANDVAVDEVGEARMPAAMVVALDRARQRRQGEPLMAGTISNGLAQPMVGRATSPDTPGLPPIEGVPATVTAPIETLALETEAGAVVRALLAASGAHHLARVVGWPAGAVAIDDTIYVNAAWLVGLAPDAGEKADGGAVAESSSGGSGTVVVSKPTGPGASLDVETATAGAPSAPAISDRHSKAVLRGFQFDAGEPSSPSENANPGDSCSACADACAASSADTGSSDSCDSSDDNTDDACNSTADDSGDTCNAAADDSDSAANCQVSRGGGRKKSGTLVWLLAPLAFLLSRRRS